MREREPCPARRGGNAGDGIAAEGQERVTREMDRQLVYKQGCSRLARLPGAYCVAPGTATRLPSLACEQGEAVGKPSRSVSDAACDGTFADWLTWKQGRLFATAQPREGVAG